MAFQTKIHGFHLSLSQKRPLLLPIIPLLAILTFTLKKYLMSLLIDIVIGYIYNLNN
jgi:hypothetical protein